MKLGTVLKEAKAAIGRVAAEARAAWLAALAPAAPPRPSQYRLQQSYYEMGYMVVFVTIA